MSLIVLASGKLIKAPTTRTAKNDESYSVASMRAASDDGDVLVSLIAFGHAGRTLAALGVGDALSVTGRAKLSHWGGKDGQERPGLSVTVDAVLTPYQVSQRRRQINDDEKPFPSGREAVKPS
jgi:single-stranded DNA-binding protein